MKPLPIFRKYDKEGQSISEASEAYEDDFETEYEPININQQEVMKESERRNLIKMS